jgi:hypothetical protein
MPHKRHVQEGAIFSQLFGRRRAVNIDLAGINIDLAGISAPDSKLARELTEAVVHALG